MQVGRDGLGPNLSNSIATRIRRQRAPLHRSHRYEDSGPRNQCSRYPGVGIRTPLMPREDLYPSTEIVPQKTTSGAPAAHE